MYFDTPVKAISMMAATSACAYALWRGGKAEKSAGALLLLDWYATPILENQHDLSHAQVSIFALDAVVAIVLFLIALRSNRFWPLWVSAFQILELVMHLAMLVDHRVRPIAYFIGVEISSYLILLALAIGTWLEGSDRRRRT
jgi:hypothetical protein